MAMLAIEIANAPDTKKINRVVTQPTTTQMTRVAIATINAKLPARLPVVAAGRFTSTALDCWSLPKFAVFEYAGLEYGEYAPDLGR